jgi:hypothetical protein
LVGTSPEPQIEDVLNNLDALLDDERIPEGYKDTVKTLVRLILYSDGIDEGIANRLLQFFIHYNKLVSYVSNVFSEEESKTPFDLEIKFWGVSYILLAALGTKVRKSSWKTKLGLGLGKFDIDIEKRVEELRREAGK